MSNTFKLEDAIKCIKVIVDSNKCEICDNTAGARVRFICGHLLCDVCMVNGNHCLLCLTPPDKTAKTSINDKPCTRRVNNAITLLKTFQEAFQVDVIKRRKISDQLKIEKEVFPSCIQAPIKYFNKRKSFISLKNKENKGPAFFPGEQISPIKVVKMENSLDHVEKWLDNNKTKLTKNQQRKPFADLNTNQRIPTRTDKIMKIVKDDLNKKLRRKKTCFKSSKSIVESQSLLDQYLKPVEKGNEFKRIYKHFQHHDVTNLGIGNDIKTKTDKDESGIVMDDEPIVIDDSQTEQIDKDKLAWLAVLEANNTDPYTSSQTLILQQNDIIGQTYNIDQNDEVKVPFYKKGYLTETCNVCKAIEQQHISTYKTAGKSKDVLISIENSSFTTTIKMSTVENKPNLYKHSTFVQTEISQIDILSSKQETENSQDLFTDDLKTIEKKTEDVLKEVVKMSNEPPMLVIADSDSDEAANQSSIVQVTADIHKSSEPLENGILVELNQNEIKERAKRSVRGITPNSTDSSDKENYDPNKAKRVKLNKKGMKKNTRYDNFELDSIFSFND